MAYKNNLEGDLKMFLLEDGREHLFQWDINRRIQVEDPTITEVHFCNRTDECSLVVDTYTDDTYDGKVYADIPNIILQQPWDIRVYAYCTGGYTKVEEVFEVKARSKPADYVYTETEIRDFDTLSEELNEEIDERIKAVEEGLITDGFATKEYVEEAIEGINTCTTYYFDPEAIEWQTGLNPTHAPDDLVEFAQKVLAGEHVNLWIKDLTWQPAMFISTSNGDVQFQRIDTPYPGAETLIQPYQVYLRTDGIWAVKKLKQVKYFYADDDYVNTAIQTALSGIAQAEGGAY